VAEGLLIDELGRLVLDANGDPIPHEIKVRPQAIAGAPESTRLASFGVYRNEGCTQVLDDWPEVKNEQGQAVKPRSPKWILGKNDYIYFEFLGPAGHEHGHFKVHVTSESDAEHGVKLFLTQVYPGVYRNIKAQKQLLRLGQTTEEPLQEDDRMDQIKVVDEEVLEFKLLAAGDEAGRAKKVMVDRGEWMGVAGSGWEGDITLPDVNAALKSLRILMQSYAWWLNGWELGSEYEQPELHVAEVEDRERQMMNEGHDSSQAGASSSDFVSYVGHGGGGGLRLLAPDMSHCLVWWGGGEPSPDGPNPSDWNNDVEYGCLFSCCLFGHDEDPMRFVAACHWPRYFKWSVDGSGSRLHGILGTSGKVQATAAPNVFARFMLYLRNGDFVYDAWMRALSNEAQPYGILVRDTNLADRVGGPMAQDDPSGQLLYLYPEAWVPLDGNDNPNAAPPAQESRDGNRMGSRCQARKKPMSVPSVVAVYGTEVDPAEDILCAIDTKREGTNITHCRATGCPLAEFKKKADEFVRLHGGYPKEGAVPGIRRMMRVHVNGDGVVAGSNQCHGVIYEIRHQLEGVRVLGDGVTIMLDAERNVVSYARRWHRATKKLREVRVRKPVYQKLDRASARGLQVADPVLCYVPIEEGMSGVILKPMWRLLHADGSEEFYDAETGERAP